MNRSRVPGYASLRTGVRVQISGTECLSNTVRTHTKLLAAGVTADLIVFECVSHGDYAAETTSPESLLTYAELDTFFLQHL